MLVQSASLLAASTAHTPATPPLLSHTPASHLLIRSRPERRHPSKPRRVCFLVTPNPAELGEKLRVPIAPQFNMTGTHPDTHTHSQSRLNFISKFNKFRTLLSKRPDVFTLFLMSKYCRLISSSGKLLFSKSQCESSNPGLSLMSFSPSSKVHAQFVAKERVTNTHTGF